VGTFAYFEVIGISFVLGGWLLTAVWVSSFAKSDFIFELVFLFVEDLRRALRACEAAFIALGEGLKESLIGRAACEMT
jgi:hypothetical protein